MHVDDLREQAEVIRANVGRRVEELRNNAQLTSEARQAQMAREIVVSNGKLDDLEKQFADRVTQERRTLERRLWANPAADADSAGASWRAALDRAETVENLGQASALLDRAERSGDVLLAKAVALRAVGRWPELARRYGQDHPEVASAMSALEDFQRETGSTAWRLASSMWFTKVPTPPELSRLANLARVAGM